MKHEDKIIKARLAHYYEHGMLYPVGMAYSEENNNQPIWLENGDLLTIFNRKSKKQSEIMWEGVLTFQQTSSSEIPIPKDMEKEDWLKFLFAEYPVNILPAKYVDEYLEEKLANSKEKQQEKIKEQKKYIRNKFMSFRKYIKAR